MRTNALIITFLLLVSACAPAIQEQVNVGIIAPLSGVRADAGKYLVNGFELALKEINENPQMKYKIRLIYEDTQYKPDLAVTAFKKVTELDGVKVVIGTQGSSEALAVAPLAQEKKIIFVTPGAQSDKLSEAGDYVFRTMTHTSQDAPILAGILAEHTRGESLYVLGIDSDATPSVMTALTPVFTEKGGKLGMLEKYGAQESDFRTNLLKLKTANAKHILLIGPPKPVALQLKQAKELGLEARYYGISALKSQEFLNAAGELAEGILFVSPYDEESPEPAVQEFRRKYEAAYDVPNEMYSAIAYDTLNILSKCFESVGPEVEAVKGCLYTTNNYPGASGTFSFDANGDVERTFVLKQVKNSSFVKIS